MFTATSSSGILQQFLREYGIVRFGFCVIPDDQGFQHYKLCAEEKRHYDVRFRKGQAQLSGYTACDGSCANGDLVENPSPELLLAVGINKRIPADSVLVVLEFEYSFMSHREYTGGSIVGPETFASGKLLKNGESMKTIRTLNRLERIDLTPIAVNGGTWCRIQDKEKIITEIVDTITNVDGKPVITNNEAELRAERDRLNEAFEAEMKKIENEQKKRRQEYARNEGRYLRQECGFSFEEVGKLFDIAGPGQCRDAVELARKMLGKRIERKLPDDWDGLNLSLMASTYHSSWERKNWRRTTDGAEYIISIGGVPADKKKKR